MNAEKSATEEPARSDEKQSVFERLTRCLVFVEKVIAALLLFVILATMATQVFARYIFGTPISFAEELCRLMLIWMTFISAAYVMGEGKHIAVDAIASRLGKAGNLFIECFTYVVVAVSCLLLLIGGSNFMWYMRKVGSPSLEVPKIFWYGAVGVGLILMTIHAILNLLQVISTGKPIEREVFGKDDGIQLEMGDRK